MDTIHIRGARTHNLKNIQLDIPRNQLVVITGLSGSGKSSLAFDTLYAEGQRRYVESLSSYARQFLGIMEKPDVDLITGLSPAISIEQKATSHNPRSTVGTVTEIYDYLRLLYARVGEPYCPKHNILLAAQSISQMVDHVLALPSETRLMILSPLIIGKKGEQQTLLAELRAQGFTRLRIDGHIYEIDNVPALQKNHKHDIDIVIDRLKVRFEAKQRIAESFETALRHSDGKAITVEMDSGFEQVFSSKFSCSHCGYALTELQPRLFSFNNPVGACRECDGLGTAQTFDPKRVVAFPSLSVAGGAIKGWDRRNENAFEKLLKLSQYDGFDVYTTPFEQLPKPAQQRILYGTGKDVVYFEGIIPYLERRYKETDSEAVRADLANYMHIQPCVSCEGTRLKVEARYVKISNRSIFEITQLPLKEAYSFFKSLNLLGQKLHIAEKIIDEVLNRLQFLIDVGLDYLQLSRSADTLSGGEAQRIRLASQIGAGLTGVMYVLDEPSIGLHQRDNDRLLNTLKHLRDLGNSVLVVEHDEDAIRHADHVIDMGPGAGEHGGKVMAQGTPLEIMENLDSITGQYLSGRERIPLPERRTSPSESWFCLKGAHGNNLKHIELKIPAGLLTCITGVSGSGKSTLINDTLYAIMARYIYNSNIEPAPFESVEGLDLFDKVINVDQSPIGRTPRSNPATYTGLFSPIRDLFSSVPESRSRGYTPGRFSFNVKGGRCEACQGDGLIKVEMHFLPDVYVTCDLCHGQRYNRETLEITYKGKNITEILNLTVESALNFFEAVTPIARRLKTLMDVGLSYIQLGQSATTLSGGEAQRVKLALELSKKDTGRTLLILDEPTTGLHFQDIRLLLNVLKKLRDHGNTIIVIEHNLDVIKTADWIVDLGPEGGEGGGNILVAGPPELIAQTSESFTGKYLAKYLEKNK